eukprot:350136-Chlamydomonas_euryale.AAC.7
MSATHVAGLYTSILSPSAVDVCYTCSWPVHCRPATSNKPRRSLEKGDRDRVELRMLEVVRHVNRNAPPAWQDNVDDLRACTHCGVKRMPLQRQLLVGCLSMGAGNLSGRLHACKHSECPIKSCSARPFHRAKAKSQRVSREALRFRVRMTWELFREWPGSSAQNDLGARHGTSIAKLTT